MDFINTNIKKTISTFNLRIKVFNPVLLSIVLLACEEFVSINPPKTQIVSETVFTNDATATSVILGIYSKMTTENSNFTDGGNNCVTVLAGLSADEFNNYLNNAINQNFHANEILPSNSYVLWQPPYQFIYYANSLLEGLARSNDITAATKNQLTGEAKFIRAFCHFYLVNLYGGVPIITTTDYRINSIVSRSTVVKVYEQIVSDLKDAQFLLGNDYSFSNGERVRPNKWSATALLARTYLYMGDWVNAEAQASSVIDNATYSLITDINNVFLKNATESIWQLIPVTPNINTREGNIFISTTIPQSVSLRTELLDAFEEGDLRRTGWVGSVTIEPNTFYFPFKYKVKSGSPLTEYYTVLRLAEQYLIRAEARAQQNIISGAQADTNVIRNRAGLPNTTANDKASLLLAIEQERRIELFSEWGHRWMDLKRTNRADTVLSTLKAPNWQSTDTLYPIPQSELNNNINLIQNDGY